MELAASAQAGGDAASSAAERLPIERSPDERGCDPAALPSQPSVPAMSVSSQANSTAHEGTLALASSHASLTPGTSSRPTGCPEEDKACSVDGQIDNNSRLDSDREKLTFEEAMQTVTTAKGVEKHKDAAILKQAAASESEAKASKLSATTEMIGDFDMDVDFGDSSDSDNNGSIYDEIPMSEMTFDEDNGRYTYPCPCGDLFEIYLEDLEDGEDIAYCPSCSLKIKILNITI